MNMRYVTAWVAALVCAALGSSSLLAAFAPSAPLDVNLVVDLEVEGTPISPAFIGVSASAANHGNGVAAGGVSIAAVTATSELRSDLIRFPDDISQSYHWASAATDNEMSTFELWSLSDQAQIPNRMFTVNMVTGSPDEAKNWVEYANAPANTSQGAQRASLHADPFNVEYWMLGERIRDYPVRYPTAASFAAAAVANASRMKAVSPSIQVGIWMDDGLTPEGASWNQNLTAALGQLDPGQNGSGGARLIDFGAVEVDADVPNRPLTDGSLFPTLYGYAALRAEQVVTAAERAVANLTHALPVAVYRYGINFGKEGWNQDKADSLGASIALSGMLDALLHMPNLLTAVYAGLNPDGFNALLKVPTAYDLPAEQRFGLNPFGEVLASYGQYLDGKSLSTGYSGFGVGASLAEAYYRAPPVGSMPGDDRVPLVAVAAAFDANGSQLLLFLASHALSDPVRVHLTVANTGALQASHQVLVTSIGGEPLAADSYTGASHLAPHTSQRDLSAGDPSPGNSTFVLTLDRNSQSAFVFSFGA